MFKFLMMFLNFSGMFGKYDSELINFFYIVIVHIISWHICPFIK